MDARGTEFPSSKQSLPVSGARPEEQPADTLPPRGGSGATQAVVTVTLWRSVEASQGGERQAMSWSDLVSVVSRPIVASSKKSLRAWNFATFQGDRRREGATVVELVHALVLDYDGGATLDAATLAWAPFRGVMHTTHSHVPEQPRFRAILLLSRPVDPIEFPALWRWAEGRVRAAGHAIDPHCRDATRLWFAPARRPDAPYEVRELGGASVDVDAVLSTTADTTPPSCQPGRPRDRARHTDQVARCGEVVGVARAIQPEVGHRARGYIAAMPAAVSGCHGQDATYDVAVALVRGFALSVDEALRLLVEEYNPRCEPPWTEAELRHKAESASKTSRMTMGCLLREAERRLVRIRYADPQVHANRAAPGWRIHLLLEPADAGGPLGIAARVGVTVPDSLRPGPERFEALFAAAGLPVPHANELAEGCRGLIGKTIVVELDRTRTESVVSRFLRAEVMAP